MDILYIVIQSNTGNVVRNNILSDLDGSAVSMDENTKAAIIYAVPNNC